LVEIKFDMDLDGLEAALMDHVRADLQERLGSIRHPVTGEFPTVLVTKLPDGNLNMHIEGSEEVVALVRERLGLPGENEREPTNDSTVAPSQHIDNAMSASPPRAFLSFAYEDRALAEAIANLLMENGVNTWWAEWEIRAGDSLRQKIDAGLRDFTHFIALLTPRSIHKPWVQLELDAGLVRKLNEGTQLIALRSELSPQDLPPLLQGLNSPQIDPANLDIKQLVNDIHGVSRKPALGNAPRAITANNVNNSPKMSSAAAAVAQLYVEQSPRAWKFQPMLSFEEISAATGLTEEDARDAVHELQGMLTVHHGDAVYPEEELFVQMDRFWKPWNPEDDALSVAAAMVNGAVQGDPHDIAKHFGWDARRLNPAFAYLANRNLVKALKSLSDGDFVVATMMKTDNTRRFVKSRQ
jgi:hypothetical protein